MERTVGLTVYILLRFDTSSPEYCGQDAQGSLHISF